MAIRNEMLDRLVSQLSPEGRDLWEEAERLAEDVPESLKRTPEGNMTPDHRAELIGVVERSRRLPPRDQEVWDRLTAAKKHALESEVRRRVEEEERDV